MSDANDFWRDSAFEQRWPATGQRPATEAELADYLGRVDPLIAAFWSRYGWARFGNGLLLSDAPGRLAAAYTPWRLPPDRVAVVRSAWGHLLALEGARAFLLDPLHGEERELGCDAVTALDALFVLDDVLDGDLMQGTYLAAIARLGRVPSHDECLSFVPALALGGVADAPNAEIRDLATTLDLLAQL